ncbi:MAG: hypothetical protein WD468_05125 [Pirellulales bacterium]
MANIPDGYEQPTRMIHHLARTGGTLISKCIGAMQDVYLLSEINPLGTGRFNPLRQAHDWFKLVDSEEVEEIEPGNEERFRAAIILLKRRCVERGGLLVLRDWSHLDFLGFPFNPCPTQTLNLRDSLLPLGSAKSIATIRNPIDQYLSLKRLEILQPAWDEEKVWSGIRAFAESVQGMPWIRYEDFVSSPKKMMQKISESLGLLYDDSFIDNWHRYKTITGDTSSNRSNQFRRTVRSPVSPELWQRLGSNPDFFAALELLGYPAPE